MLRTAVIRLSAALSIGLLMSAVTGGAIASASTTARVGTVRTTQCLAVRVGVAPSICVEFSSKTELTSSVNPSRFGQTVTFKATVSEDFVPSLRASGVHPLVPPAPTGTVDFTNNGKELCPGVTLDVNGEATCTKSGLVVGVHDIRANYNGDQLYDTSSDALDQTVKKAGTHSVISSSSRNSEFGEPVTLGVFVYGQAGWRNPDRNVPVQDRRREGRRSGGPRCGRPGLPAADE